MYVFMGGSFDPVHIGHLRIATELAEYFSQTLHLLPCKEPVHKHAARATSAQRLAMLQAAVLDDANLLIDGRELGRETQSYTIDTLQELHEQMACPIVMAVGSDSALGLASWRHANEFSKLCHLVVLKRPGSSHAALAGVLEALGFRLVAEKEELLSSEYGMAIELEMSQIDISSSSVRERIEQDKSIRYLVTDAVESYICDNSLYKAE